MASKYGAMKKAFATPGMQDGEKDAVAAIAKNRGVSMKKAAAIGKRRTAKGLNTAGVKGPKGMGPHDRKVAKGDARYKDRRRGGDASGGRGTNDPTPAPAARTKAAVQYPELMNAVGWQQRTSGKFTNISASAPRTGGTKATAGPGSSTKQGPKPAAPKTVTGRSGGTGKRAI